MIRSTTFTTFAAFAAFIALAPACEPPSDDAGDDTQATTDDAAYARFGHRWPTAFIPVCWNNPGSTADMDVIKSAVSAAWQVGTPVYFQYWGACSAYTGSTDPIRINIVDRRTAASIGYFPGGSVVEVNTDFFNFETGSCRATEETRIACMKAVAIHEFGHALGLRHEQDRNDTTCLNEPNTEVEDGDVNVGIYDPDSVMNYCDFAYPNGRMPSLGDIQAIDVLFGWAPSPSSIQLSFASYNFPNHYIRHQWGNGEATTISTQLDRSDATFHVVQGLSNTNAISLESTNYPGYYLRHRNGRLILTQISSALDRDDATFWMGPGLANTSAFSFQSYNYPGAYIRHSYGHLYVQYSTGGSFAQDATFTAKSLRNTFSLHAWDGSMFLRHAWGSAQVTSISTDLDKQDATFTIVPGLADSRGVSFRSVNYPSYYLRHSGGRLILTQISSALDQADATFFKRPGLVAGYSFESYNYPGYYIHNRGGDVWVDALAEGVVFRQDASWALTLPKWGN